MSENKLSIKYVKGKHTFFFFYNENAYESTLRHLGAMASNPNIDFDWEDAGIVSKKVVAEYKKTKEELFITVIIQNGKEITKELTTSQLSEIKKEAIRTGKEVTLLIGNKKYVFPRSKLYRVLLNTTLGLKEVAINAKSGKDAMKLAENDYILSTALRSLRVK